MKRSEIYQKAGELIESGKFDHAAGSCWAIAFATPGFKDWRDLETYRAVKPYERLFSPENDGFVAYWGLQWREEWGGNKVVRNCRILALYFMAAITASKEKRKL